MEILNHSKEGLGVLMDKYKNFGQEVLEAITENKKAVARLIRVTEDALSSSKEKVKDMASDAQRTVKKNPWTYIGAASAAGLLFGLMLSKKK